MQKEVKYIDKDRGIMRVTTTSERWYMRPVINKETGIPEYQFVPSSTWISSYYPKGIPFYKWLAEKGWDEAEALKTSAGARGSRVHAACELLEAKGELSIDDVVEDAVLTTDELGCVMSFAAWHEKEKPVLLANEMSVFGDFYAGTLDRIYRIGKQVWIVDLKTGQSIWTEQEIQISSYSHAGIDYKALGITDEEWAARKLATLQLGYKLNKNRYKFTEVEDQYEMFKVAYEIWKNENRDSKPREVNIPLVIKITKSKN
jgi:hypothetical protein